MTSIAPYLIAASAAAILALGLVHLLCTFHGPKLLPRDRSLQARMPEVSPVITLEGEIERHPWGRQVCLGDPFCRGLCLLQWQGGGYDEAA